LNPALTLAVKADISANTLFCLLSGKRKASERTVCKIAAALSVEPSEIIVK